MNTVIKSFDRLSPMEVYRIMQVRSEVFFLEQHITEADADDIDFVSTHMLCCDGDRLVGYLRMIPPGAVCREASIGRLLVVEPYRRHGLCRQMMRKAIDYIADEWHQTSIRISAQEYLVDFYASIGFKTISERYLDAGIPHFAMLLE